MYQPIIIWWCTRIVGICNSYYYWLLMYLIWYLEMVRKWERLYTCASVPTLSCLLVDSIIHRGSEAFRWLLYSLLCQLACDVFCITRLIFDKYKFKDKRIIRPEKIRQDLKAVLFCHVLHLFCLTTRHFNRARSGSSLNMITNWE